METECIQFELDLQGGKSRKVVVKNDGAISSSDAGLVILSSIEDRRKWIKRLAGCFTDWRNQGLARYSLEGLLRQAIYGLAQGYEDLVDHDQWRHDPLLTLACGREPYLESGAGKSTLNRLELEGEANHRYKKIAVDQEKLNKLLVEIFLESHETEPAEIILDFDSSDIPLHGEQEDRFFHGYYDD